MHPTFYIGMSQTLPGEQAIGNQSVDGFRDIAMSDFSPLSIFKSQAKQQGRQHDVKLSAAQESLARQAGFEEYHELVVVAQRNPTDGHTKHGHIRYTRNGPVLVRSYHVSGYTGERRR